VRPKIEILDRGIPPLFKQSDKNKDKSKHRKSKEAFRVGEIEESKGIPERNN